MPIHIAPAMRSRELALESAGLIVAINSDGYIDQINEESTGKKPAAPVPLVTYNFNGKQANGSKGW